MFIAERRGFNHQHPLKNPSQKNHKHVTHRYDVYICIYINRLSQRNAPSSSSTARGNETASELIRRQLLESVLHLDVNDAADVDDGGANDSTTAINDDDNIVINTMRRDEDGYGVMLMFLE